jgi:large subunit ribosomal protein L24
VNYRTGKALVEGVQMIKRHTRPNPAKQIKGGIAEREASIAVSNVMIVTSGGIPTRIGFKTEGQGAGERRIRIAKKTGETLDKKGAK